MNFRIKLDAWDGLGPVDVAMCGEDSQPIAFFELKCGSRTLFNGVWDVAKMARAVQLRQTPQAFLVAAAPESDWSGAPRSEFFRTGVWTTWTDLLEPHRKSWDFWRKDVKTRPLVLPRIIHTAAVARAPFALEGSDWELRCARIAN
jgi:hypothetical protein